MKDVVLTEKGPKPIGPYSQAIKAGGFLFASGQVALYPRSNEFLSGDVRQQTERVLENIKAILEAGGANLQPRPRPLGSKPAPRRFSRA